MTVHSPAPSRSGDKRERILDAAERVFAQRGFFQARVSEIAKEAGVADGTIYLYFKSKDDLLITLFESRMERVNATLSAAVDGAGSPLEQIEAFISAYVHLIEENPNAAEVLTVELRQSAKFMKGNSNPRFGDLLRLLAGIVRAGQESGQFNSEIPAPIAARALFGMLDELALAWLLGRGEKFDIVRAAEWVSAMTLRGLERSKS